MDVKRLLVPLALIVAVAARCDEPESAPTKPTSRAASKIAAKDLRKAADDPMAIRTDRVAAVFALFANHVKPTCGPVAAGEVIGDTGWLTAAHIRPIDKLAGWVPVEFGGDATVYCLHVFPIEKEWSDSVICLRLTGGAGQSADDLRAFLHGGKGLKGTRKLVEFALCYPPGPNAMGIGRIELFSPKGLRVMFDKD
jgi:hypothetical protein